MKNIKLLVILFLLNYIFSQECSDFDNFKKAACESIPLTDATKQCYYISTNNCQENTKFTSCEDYTGSSLNSNICESIHLTTANNKCSLNSKGECSSRLKFCREYENGDTCTSLDPEGTTKYCTENNENGKCESHYKACSSITSKKDCEANIPETQLYNCYWVGGKCEELKDCTEYLGTEKNVCESIPALNDGGTDIDDNKKCVYDSALTTESKCKKESKTCTDYINGCNTYTVGNKICFESDDKCIIGQKDCTIDASITDSDEKTAACNSIIFLKNDETTIDPSHYCKMEDNICKKIVRKCSEFKEKEGCNTHDPEIDGKTCAFDEDNNECKEVYTTCKLNSNNNACASLELYVDSTRQIDNSKFCEYSSTGPTCSPKTLTNCEDYNTYIKTKQISQNYCTGITLSDNNKKCAYIENKCIEQPSSCDENEEDKKACENIYLVNEPYYKCTIVKDEKCEKKKRLCSEYSGNEEEECNNYGTSDNTSKYCTIYNGKCTEQYRFCSDYLGMDQELCESIIPYDSSTEGSSTTFTQLTNYKCIYDSKVGCMRIAKGCSEAKTSTQCLSMTPSDTNKKQCVFYNGQCSEEFKTCENYNENVEKTSCENIKLRTYATQKCVFTAAVSTGGVVTTPASCSTLSLTCSDFKDEFVRDSCENINPTSLTKCVYSGSSCTESSKSCLELTGPNPLITEEVCSNATPSDSTKQCKYKLNGCIEETKEKENNGNNNNENSGSTDNGDNNNNNNNNGNSAGKQYLSKILIFIICLLF